MPDTQASAYDVYDAQLARMTDYGQRFLDAQQCGADTAKLVESGIDLFLGEVSAALSVSETEQTVIRSNQQRTHALLGVYTSPFLQAIAASILNPGTAQPFVLGVNGGVLGVNGGVLGVGARIIPATGPPVFNTELTPSQTAGAVTFTGTSGDTFEFNMPMNASTGGPQQMFLFVNNVQVAGIDFPADAVGNYFRLTHNGIAYLDTFQIVPTTSRVDLSPE